MMMMAMTMILSMAPMAVVGLLLMLGSSLPPEMMIGMVGPHNHNIIIHEDDDDDINNDADGLLGR